MDKKVVVVLIIIYCALCCIKVNADVRVNVGETKSIFRNSACTITNCTTDDSNVEVSFNNDVCKAKALNLGEANVKITCEQGEEKLIKDIVVDENYDNTTDPNISASAATANCSSLALLVKDLQGAFKIIKFVVPILIVVMSTYDFIKAIAGKVEGEMKKAFQRLLKRLLFAVILFFLPNMLDFFLGLIDPSYTTCINS